MKTYQILKETGARPDSYFLTPSDIKTLPHLPQKPLITKLPKIFTHYSPNEKQNYPSPSASKFSKFAFEDLENALYDQAEKYLCNSQNFHSESKMIYSNSQNQSKILENLQNLKMGKIRGFPQYVPNSLKDEVLGFESRFECGNLQSAFLVNKNEYELFLQTDLGNDKYTNWFFFRVYNTRKNNLYKFTVNNMSKAKSLFNEGMKVTVFSEKLNRFFKSGEKIVYFCNFIKKKNNANFYSLSFQLKFPENFDCAYVMLNYPYTYSRVKSLEKFVLEKYGGFVERFELCKTLSGNSFGYLKVDYKGDDVLGKNDVLSKTTIVEEKNDKIEKNDVLNNIDDLVSSQKVKIDKVDTQAPFNYLLSKIPTKTKKIIIIGARVHPGETISSHIMETVITSLLAQKTETSKKLLRMYTFYLIPMINIDGVVAGNYRVNLSGDDLNRTYHDPSENLHPTIFSYKKLIETLRNQKQKPCETPKKPATPTKPETPTPQTQKKSLENPKNPPENQKKSLENPKNPPQNRTPAENPIYLFLDIHCHSKKFNTFIYSNPPLYGECNFFVEQLAKNVDFYSRKDTLFSIKKEKEKSARVVVWREFGVEHSYTLEMSYAGMSLGCLKGGHHCLESFEILGRGILEAVVGLEESERGQMERRERFREMMEGREGREGSG